MNKKYLFLLYPFLISIYYIVYLYAHNLTQTPVRDIWRLIIILLSLTGILYLLFNMYIKKVEKTSLVLGWGLFLFYLVVPVQMILINNLGLDGDIFRRRYFMMMFFVLFVLIGWILVKKDYATDKITKIANIFTLTLFVIPLIEFLSYVISIGNMDKISGLDSNFEVFQSEIKISYTGGGQSPDVYYILLDSHASLGCLKDKYGFDDHEFVEKLKRIGFYVAEQSASNYPSATLEALPSTFNMNYYDHEFISHMSSKDALNYFQGKFYHNKVVSIFKSLGYDFINFYTRYPMLDIPNEQHFYDDFFYPGTKIPLPNRFETFFISNTPLSGLFILFDEGFIHYSSIIQLLDYLPTLPGKYSSPIFVYSHLLIPHVPYVFSSDGKFNINSDYLSEVEFIDSQIFQVIEKIIHNSIEPPIIVLQGDTGHGECSIPILNAYYLPNVNYENYLYPQITPVNTFRLIFNIYFNGDFNLLEDNIYLDTVTRQIEHRQGGIPFNFVLCNYESTKYKCE